MGVSFQIRLQVINSGGAIEFAQPANLQGIWSRWVQPPWSANWTLNCNAEINYWPATITNLEECHEPLIQMIQELSEADFEATVDGTCVVRYKDKTRDLSHKKGEEIKI